MLHKRCAGRGTRARGARNCPRKDLRLQLQLEGQAGVSVLSGWSGHPGSRERKRILVRKDREDTVLSEEKGTASHATRRSR